MSGSTGDDEGTVYLAHAWVPNKHRDKTVGPWHWWNVYKDADTAQMQAVRVSSYAGWKRFSTWEVVAVTGEANHD